MSRLTDEHDAARAERAGALDLERKHAALGLELDLAQDRMGAPFDLGRKLAVREGFKPCGIRRIGNEDEVIAKIQLLRDEPIVHERQR